MGIGLPIEREHVVEFIRGTGVKIDGVTYSNYNGGGVNGPWTWTIPPTITSLVVDIVGGGCGGGGGWNTGTSLAGGGGGSSGASLSGALVDVIPNSTLTITVGAGGTGGAAASYGNLGGRSSISGGIIVNALLGANEANLNKLDIGISYSGEGSPGSSTGGGAGGITGNNSAGYSSGTSNISTGPSLPGSCVGYHMSTDSVVSEVRVFGKTILVAGGAGGGGASTTVTTSGANGGGRGAGGSNANAIINGYTIDAGIGDTTGTISRGGGGAGASSDFGKGGTGGSNGGNGGNAVGYGAGGGGGAGGGAGGNGSDGYVRLKYYSIT